jgi:ABC-type sugar transport system substrate-binding protein
MKLREPHIRGSVRCMRPCLALALALAVAACAASPAARPPVERAEKTTRPVPPEPTLTPEVVLSTIRSRYLGGLERCYRRHLKKQAAANGRVLVSFTVDPSGRATEGAARGIAERVDDCITAQVMQWRFPAPAAEARFAVPLQLYAN